MIPDIMGMRPLFDDLVARLAIQQGWSVAAFELFAGREDLDVANRLAAGSSLEDDLSPIYISEPTRPERILYAVFCLKKKNKTYSC